MFEYSDESGTSTDGESEAEGYNLQEMIGENACTLPTYSNEQ